MSWLKVYKPGPDGVIDLTTSDEEKEPQWRVERRMRSVARMSLRKPAEETAEEMAGAACSSTQSEDLPAPKIDAAGHLPVIAAAATGNATVAKSQPTPVHATNNRACATTRMTAPSAAAVAKAEQEPRKAAAVAKAEQEARKAAVAVAKAEHESRKAAAAVAKAEEEARRAAAVAMAEQEPRQEASTQRETLARQAGQSSEKPDDLYLVWHGDSDRSTTDVETNFDWRGIRRRAKMCRDRLDAAAQAAEPQPDTNAENLDGHPSAGNALGSQDTPPCALPINLREIFSRLKNCWVTTTSNGVTVKEWRAPDWTKPAPTRSAKIKCTTKKVTAAKSDCGPIKTARLASAANQSSPELIARLRRGKSSVVVRRSPRYTHSQAKFVKARWPPKIVYLGANFNPLDVKFAFETPFAGVCECALTCRYSTCPNGILGIFCSRNCCDYKGKCGNGLQEHESLELVRRRGSSDLAVLATEKIEAGTVLGEYLGAIQAVPKDPSTKTTSPMKTNSGYRYEIKRTSASHPDHAIYIDAADMGGITRFMNHSCNAAAVFQEVRNGKEHKVVVVSERDLLPGEEVTVNYGSDLWFLCMCGEPSCQHRDLYKPEE